MSDIDPPKDESQKEKNEIIEKEEKKENEKAEEKKEEEIKEEKKEEKEEDKKEEEDEKSEEEKEKSESSKDSDIESDESKNSKESKESKEDKKSKDKKEKDEEENEEDDDDDDDLDDDVDDEGNSDESSSENKQKDPYHGYLNSKTEYKSFVVDIRKNNYVYGFKQNKFYKLIDLKNIANDKKAQLYKFELKEIKNNGEGGKKINVKLAKNIQYMASIYGKAQEEEKEKDIKEKDKDIKEKKENKNKDKDKDKEEKNSENNLKKENSNTSEEKNEKNIEKENKSDDKDKKTEEKDNIEEERKNDNIEENKNKIEENKESQNKDKDNKEENKDKDNKEENKEENKDKDKEKPKDKKEKEKDTKKKNNKKKAKNLNTFAVIKDLTEYTFFQKIRVIYLNSLNNPVVFYLKININTSIKEIIDQFSDLYHYKHDRYSDKIPLHIFINGKKHSISNQTQSKYFIPTKFDYKNDYILILEKQTFKLKELDVGSRTNYMNLKGVEVVHAVYNSLYNYEVDSFLITKGITSLDCQVYELKKELNIRQYTDNEHTIKQKLREFLDSNWKEKTNFVTTFKSIKVKNSKSYNCDLFEISRKFILLVGKIYVFVIKSNNKKVDVFNGKRIHTEGVYIVSKNNKSILDGFRAKAISDFTANS